MKYDRKHFVVSALIVLGLSGVAQARDNEEDRKPAKPRFTACMSSRLPGSISLVASPSRRLLWS